MNNIKRIFFYFLFSLILILILYIPNYFFNNKVIVKYKEVEKNISVINKNVLENTSPLRIYNKYEITYGYVNDNGEWVNFTDEVSEETYNKLSIGDTEKRIIKEEVK